MKRFFPFSLLLLVILSLSAAGCSDDATQPGPAAGDTGVIRGQIGDADFEFTIDAAGTPGDPIEGPFVLRGTNLHYDEAAGALVVDLTLRNAGIVAHPEPIGLTFLDLIPGSVTVLNPDNGEHGDGAAFDFPFANDDGMWTPGETSLARTVQFGVDPGVSIGFVAHLDIGTPTGGGTIAGLVWHDIDQDGILDGGEPGLPGVGIHLRSFAGENEDSTVTRELRFTRTGNDGRYAFDHVPAGAYVVSKALSTIDFFPTTPTEIHVLLVEINGEVADFLDANFGCVPQTGPPPISIGTYVETQGEFSEPESFDVATIVTLPCPADTIPGGPDDRVARDVRPDPCHVGTLRGPVTAVARENSFRIMNTWVAADAAMIPPLGISVGDRLDVRVRRDGNFITWIVDAPIEKWDGTHEEIHGRVDAIGTDASGGLLIRVFDTWLAIPNVAIPAQ
jgi:hypothetical protein